jgi:hypothetical protein
MRVLLTGVVNPRFRFGVMGVFSEALTGLPTGAATWQLGGVAPLAIGHGDPVTGDLGPVPKEKGRQRHR